MTDQEKKDKVNELVSSEDRLTASITTIESSYKLTVEQKALFAMIDKTEDEIVIEVLRNRLETFKNDEIDIEGLISICQSHGFSLPEVVKNGLSKIRGGYMFRRKTLATELKKAADNE